MKKERGGGESVGLLSPHQTLKKFTSPPLLLFITPHVGGVGDEVRGRAERNKISWEEKDDVIGQEG